MFEFEKRWQEHHRRKSILKDIEKAKQLYVDRKSHFMCLCFMQANFKRYKDIYRIREWIPEFNREFLGAQYELNSEWWDAFDRESRIKAFDKLIEVYSK